MTQLDVIALEAMGKIAQDEELLLMVDLTDEDMIENPQGEFIKNDDNAYYLIPNGVDTVEKKYSIANYYTLIAKRSYQLAVEMQNQSNIYNQSNEPRYETKKSSI